MIKLTVLVFYLIKSYFFFNFPTEERCFLLLWIIETFLLSLMTSWSPAAMMLLPAPASFRCMLFKLGATEVRICQAAWRAVAQGLYFCSVCVVYSWYRPFTDVLWHFLTAERNPQIGGHPLSYGRRTHAPEYPKAPSAPRMKCQDEQETVGKDHLPAAPTETLEHRLWVVNLWEDPPESSSGRQNAIPHRHYLDCASCLRLVTPLKRLGTSVPIHGWCN